MRRALRKVVGAYAIAVIDRNHPEHIVAARQSSPLVVGMGQDEAEYFIASDATPIVEYTKQVVYLDDGQIADIRPGQPLHIVNLEAQDVEVDIKEVDMDISKLSKGGFPHFMLKEIYDQPQCLQDCLSGRLTIDNTRPELNKIVLSAVEDHKERLISAKHTIIVELARRAHRQTAH